MGAIIHAKLLVKGQKRKLIDAAAKVNLEIEIERDAVLLHYAYWSAAHIRRCRAFIDDLEQKKILKVTYRGL